MSGDVSGDVSGGPPLGALLVQLRHEDDSGGAFAAVVLGGAEHPFSLAAWGRSELEHVEEGAMPATAPKRPAQPSDFALLVELWLLDGSHRSGLHAPFTPNESRWHLALLEVDPRTSHTPHVQSKPGMALVPALVGRGCPHLNAARVGAGR